MADILWLNGSLYTAKRLHAIKPEIALLNIPWMVFPLKAVLMATPSDPLDKDSTPYTGDYYHISSRWMLLSSWGCAEMKTSSALQALVRKIVQTTVNSLQGRIMICMFAFFCFVVQLDKLFNKHSSVWWFQTPWYWRHRIHTPSQLHAKQQPN